MKYWLLFSLLIMYSCHENKEAKIISEWIGKEIFLPDKYICKCADKDTTLFTCLDLLKKEYKILVYIDSTMYNL
ncbi:MAG: hypothetical protein LBG15_04995 [Dysgonamonadaceae bacterium]|nr:hypothetical protein [Dysgonamonadaceae bacterium]